MKISDTVRRSRVAYEAIRAGAKNNAEVGDALVRAGLYYGSAAEMCAQRIVNNMIARGRIVRVGGQLRVKGDTRV